MTAARTDEEARRIIRENLDVSLIVEAAAGTGKTTELVRRVVSVLQKGRAKVERVVVVTFTRKAAGELKLRLRQALDAARRETTAEHEIANLEDALARLEDARIGTIHSFCGELLRERPVEARIDPGFEELDEGESARLFQRVFSRWFQAKLDDMPTGLRRVLSRPMSNWNQDTPGERVESAARRLAEWRDFPAAWRSTGIDRDAAIDALSDQLRSLAEMLTKAKSSKDRLANSLEPVSSLSSWIEKSRAEGALDLDELEGRLVELDKALEKNNYKGQGRFSVEDTPTREQVMEARDELKTSLARFSTATSAELASLLQAELTEVVDQYQETKHQLGKLDFADLLIEARNLIRDNRQVRAHFQKRFSHLFIDEFQDTDPLQAEIFLLLSADDPDETDWSQVRPRPGKLFLVGDPKQSIYRFRRADVVLYQAIKDALVARGVELVELSRSFRATRPLQAMLNACFEAVIKEDAVRGQPGYVPLEGGPEATSERPSIVSLPVPRPFSYQGVSDWAIREQLPSTLAAYVHWLVEESGWSVRDPEDPAELVPIRPRHIALLFRRYSSFGADVTAPYLRALEARDIPHVMIGARSFHDREEIETIRAALTAIEWPDDELSVFATLRGSLFSFDDASLFRFRDSTGTLHPYGKAPEGLDSDLAPIAEALASLRALNRRRNERPLVETLTEILELTRAHAGFALRPAGNQVLSNVQRLFDLARSFEMRGGLSFRGFVEQLNAEAEKGRTIEAPVLEEGAEGVRIMTAHAAKGLEFPIVILADLDTKGSYANPDRHIDGRRGLAALKLMGCTPLELQENAELERNRDEVEGLRLCYVAATRAKDLLVVPAVGSAPHGSWFAALNAGIYPEAARWSESDAAPGCPSFGPDSVLQSDPQSPNPRRPRSVRPGLHSMDPDFSVVWWDPAALALDSKARVGVRAESILVPVDEADEDEDEGRERHEAWLERRAAAKDEGEAQSYYPFSATEALYEPPGYDAQIEVISLDRPRERPSGVRFGRLVHSILRDVDLEVRPDALAVDLAKIHGRVLGASDPEIEAAAAPVLAALSHPLLDRARKAERCHREFPVMSMTADGSTLEGEIDLLFLEAGEWTVIDFKTDIDLGGHLDRYRRQIAWYLYAIEHSTGQKARGVLLGL